MKKFWACLTAFVFAIAPVSALGFSYVYAPLDLSGGPFDANNNTAPISYDGVGPYPSPGYLGEGGEPFDLEGFFMASDNDYYYFSLTSSFGVSATSHSYAETYYQGDIFFGFGSDTYTHAIDVSTGSLVLVNAWEGIPDYGTYYGTWVEAAVGEFEVTDFDDIGSANQVLTFWDGYETGGLTPDWSEGDTYVWEWKVAKTDFGWDGTSDLFVHTTLGCGNDLLETRIQGSAIPEPSTLILIGFGLCGCGIMRKFRR
jgi:hypothetical protein